MSSNNADRAAIQLRTVDVSQRAEVCGVSIKCVHLGIPIGDCRPIHLDKSCARFNQATAQQKSLAKSVAAVAVPSLVGFFGEIEGVASAPGQNQVKGLLLIGI